MNARLYNQPLVSFTVAPSIEIQAIVTLWPGLFEERNERCAFSVKDYWEAEASDSPPALDTRCDLLKQCNELLFLDADGNEVALDEFDSYELSILLTAEVCKLREWRRL